MTVAARPPNHRRYCVRRFCDRFERRRRVERRIQPFPFSRPCRLGMVGCPGRQPTFESRDSRAPQLKATLVVVPPRRISVIRTSPFARVE